MRKQCTHCARKIIFLVNNGETNIIYFLVDRDYFIINTPFVRLLYSAFSFDASAEIVAIYKINKSIKRVKLDR